MLNHGAGTFDLAARGSETITIVSERNKGGTWSIAAYLQSDSGPKNRRRLATCERKEDAASVLRHFWSAI